MENIEKIKTIRRGMAGPLYSKMREVFLKDLLKICISLFVIGIVWILFSEKILGKESFLAGWIVVIFALVYALWLGYVLVRIIRLALVIRRLERGIRGLEKIIFQDKEK